MRHGFAAGCGFGAQGKHLGPVMGASPHPRLLPAAVSSSYRRRIVPESLGSILLFHSQFRCLVSGYAPAMVGRCNQVESRDAMCSVPDARWRTASYCETRDEHRRVESLGTNYAVNLARAYV
jgi:hypothetical protein